MLLSLVGITLFFWLLSEPLIYLLHQGDVARAWIKSFGAWAPVAYISLFALQILIAPLPGQFMGVMGGYVFGIFLGSFYSITGLTIGAGLAMALARRYGRPLLERFFDRDQLKLWERKLYMRSPVNWGVLFVFPVPDVVFYLAGLSSIPLIRLVPAVIAGRSLGLLFANSVGGLTAQLPPEWVVAKWAVIVIGGLILLRQERKLRLYFLLGVRAWERWARQWWR
ncbi:MAG: TVP38/TMEM64 family protein [Caldilineaceae bacterium]|nr:TVP38/TMEM64 family protein [Caldilineaceae bacterium]